MKPGLHRGLAWAFTIEAAVALLGLGVWAAVAHATPAPPATPQQEVKP